jgi:hypothetical protein
MKFGTSGDLMPRFTNMWFAFKLAGGVIDSRVVFVTPTGQPHPQAYLDTSSASSTSSCARPWRPTRCPTSGATSRTAIILHRSGFGWPMQTGASSAITPAACERFGHILAFAAPGASVRSLQLGAVTMRTIRESAGRGPWPVRPAAPPRHRKGFHGATRNRQTAVLRRPRNHQAIPCVARHKETVGHRTQAPVQPAREGSKERGKAGASVQGFDARHCARLPSS